jgi:hypothetical protein
MNPTTKIVPVQFWPNQADTLELVPGELGPPPFYSYLLKNSANGAIYKRDVIRMTQDNWAAWPANADDTEYQLNAITSQLGLTRA